MNYQIIIAIGYGIQAVCGIVACVYFAIYGFKKEKNDNTTVHE